MALPVQSKQCSVYGCKREAALFSNHEGTCYFCTGEACDSRTHCVADLGLERVMTASDEERFALLLDHRQASKSTLALAAARARSRTYVIMAKGS